MDGFRRGLGSAIQWLDCLRVMADRLVNQRLQRAFDQAEEILDQLTPPNVLLNKADDPRTYMTLNQNS